MTGWQRILTGLGLLALLSGCSLMKRHDFPEQSGYCLRAGQEQAFDCSAPALEVNQVRDPLQPRTHFTDEELFSLLSEVKRWLERERLIAAGEPVPPHLLPQEAPAAPPAPVSPTGSPLWPRVLEALSH
ncbi:hypothetical protein [Marinobacterium iners]|uniref:Lipoprotein n=1 Tax=Marinobacterium iners DSM 11526 TaxID=1122198 RepID=A0A1H4CLG7_9GAMM|nr:hypothetical protein [Marinobacterium iners]SEA61276.1 hypothetical protein SAMN02745729_10557 [Marinobacterium iners DSM 11526]